MITWAIRLRALKSLLALALFASALTVSAREFDLEVPDSVQATYAPFSGLPLLESFNIKLISLDDDDEDEQEYDDEDDNELDLSDDDDDDDATNYGLRFRPSNLGKFALLANSKSSLPFSIASANPQPFTLVNGAYMHALGSLGASSKTLSLTYDLAIAESIWAAPGNYSIFLNVDLVNLDNPEDVLVSRELEFTAVVEPKLQTNLAGQLGSFSDGSDIAVINFETLETGESKKIFIQVRGNAKALISLSSQNNGKMVHSVNPKWQVDYSVEVDGETSGLESPMHLQRSVARDFRGSAYPMTVTIGDVESSFSGKYSDIITVDVSPQ